MLITLTLRGRILGGVLVFPPPQPPLPPALPQVPVDLPATPIALGSDNAISTTVMALAVSGGNFKVSFIGSNSPGGPFEPFGPAPVELTQGGQSGTINSGQTGYAFVKVRFDSQVGASTFAATANTYRA